MSDHSYAHVPTVLDPVQYLRLSVDNDVVRNKFASQFELHLLRQAWRLPKITSTDSLDNVCNDYLRTRNVVAVKLASAGGYVDLLKLCISSGAYIELDRCLIVASLNGQYNVVDYLISNHVINDRAIKSSMFKLVGNIQCHEAVRIDIFKLLETKYPIWDCLRTELRTLAVNNSLVEIARYLSK